MNIILMKIKFKKNFNLRFKIINLKFLLYNVFYIMVMFNKNFYFII